MRELARIRRAARNAIDEPRLVTVRGTVRGIGKRLEAPLTKRTCVAYTARDTAGEESHASSRFVVVVGDDSILVEPRACRVLAEVPRNGQRYEAILCDGDEVVVRGLLSRGDAGAGGRRDVPGVPLRIVGFWDLPLLIVLPPERGMRASSRSVWPTWVARLVKPVRATASTVNETARRLGRYATRMSDKPIIVVPKSSQVSQMLDAVALSIEPRAQRSGVIVIAPRTMKPADLMVSCHFWPRALRDAGVRRVAVVLGVESYVQGRPVLMACKTRFHELGITVEYFHEAHLESDQIRAWFESRRPRKRVSTDTLVKLAERYTARGDVRAAQHALRIAEAAATQEPEVVNVPANRDAVVRASATTVAA